MKEHIDPHSLTGLTHRSPSAFDPQFSTGTHHQRRSGLNSRLLPGPVQISQIALSMRKFQIAGVTIVILSQFDNCVNNPNLHQRLLARTSQHRSPDGLTTCNITLKYDEEFNKFQFWNDKLKKQRVPSVTCTIRTNLPQGTWEPESQEPIPNRTFVSRL